MTSTKTLEALEMAAMKGYAHCIRRDVAPHWVLTELGQKSMRLAQTQGEARRVCVGRPNVELGDLHVLEFYTALESQGWTFSIWEPGTSHTPCEVGFSKFVWIKRAAEAFNPWYFLCLLKAEAHKQPVQHGRAVDGPERTVRG